MKLYYAIPDSGDGVNLPTTPDPMPMEQIGKHLNEWLARFQVQGYYFDCRQRRVPLGDITFTIAYSGEEVTPTEESEADKHDLRYAMLDLLRTVPLGLHKPAEGEGPCLCSQCEFRNGVRVLLAKVREGK